ncbi:11978_t:CDS:2, partial [Gigaspora rosea]
SNPTLKGKWVEQLATRNQQIEEDEDAYHAAIQELLRRPTKVCRLDEREEAKIDENLTDSKEEFEEKKLEEKIYNYLGIDNKERNYYYVPEAEELNLKGSLEFDETWEKRPFSNLADYIALLKSQLKSELPITLNTINASFTANKDITFENSKHTDNNSKPILSLQYI